MIRNSPRKVYRSCYKILDPWNKRDCEEAHFNGVMLRRWVYALILKGDDLLDKVKRVATTVLDTSAVKEAV